MIRHLLFLTALLLVPWSSLLAQNQPVAEYNVRDYGAVGDGTTVNTVAIQNAVDAISASGGGKLVFPPGTYLIPDDSSPWSNDDGANDELM